MLIPAIWPFEVANALQVTERRKRITVARVTALLRRSPGFRFQQSKTQDLRGGEHSRYGLAN